LKPGSALNHAMRRLCRAFRHPPPWAGTRQNPVPSSAVYFGQVMNAASTPPAPRRTLGVAAVAAYRGEVLGVAGIYKQQERPLFKQRSVSRPRWHCPTVLRSTQYQTAGYGSIQPSRASHSSRTGAALFKVAHARTPFWVRAADFYLGPARRYGVQCLLEEQGSEWR